MAAGREPGRDVLPLQPDSFQALDDTGASTASGAQLDQSFVNSSNAQVFKLIPQP
jgi:hypothetical protein